MKKSICLAICFCFMMAVTGMACEPPRPGLPATSCETTNNNNLSQLQIQQSTSGAEAQASVHGVSATGGNVGNVSATGGSIEGVSGGAGGVGYGGHATAGVSNSGNSSVSGSGNSQVSVTNHYRVPMRLVTPEMIDPVVTVDVIFPELDGQTYDIDGIAVTFVVSEDYGKIIVTGMQQGDAPKLLGSAQNHGKKLFARLHSRTGEFVDPVEQAVELAQLAPEGTKGMIVRVKTSVHTRGSAGVASAGHDNNRSFIESVAANMAGSYYLPFVYTTATFYDRPVGFVNCNYDPTNELCPKEEEKK